MEGKGSGACNRALFLFHSRMPRITVLLLATLISSGAVRAQSTTHGPRVIPVYMVPRGMPLSMDRLQLTVKALESAAQWYGRVLGGRTFSYDPLIVQVSRHSFAEFAADSFQAWWPLLQEEFQAYGQDWKDDNTKVVWIAHGAGAWAGADSENGGIDSIAEAGQVDDGDRGGLAVIGDSTLGGYLAGVCPDSGRTGTAWWCSWNTFVGTLAHELGHTWGLPHPDAFLPGFRCADSTAWTNMQCHWGFPFDSLLPYEQTHLTSLRYFRYRTTAPYQLLSGVHQHRGRFQVINVEAGDSILWVQGRGGGTGYLHGILLNGDLSLRLEGSTLVTEIGLPRGASQPVIVRIGSGGAERYSRRLEPGDPPLPVAIPLRRHERLTIRSDGLIVLGNARVMPQ